MTSLAARASAIRESLERTANDYQRKLAVVERLNQQFEAAAADESRFRGMVENEEKAQAVLLALEAAWRKDFERNVEKVITEGLQLVFGTTDYFTVITKVERGASAIEFELETPEGAVQNILDAEGGSVAQIVSFLLRILLILSYRPQLRKVIVLDEPFVGMDDEKLPNVAALLRKMVDEAGIQIIMVTHYEPFIDVADVAYEVIKTKGVGRVERIAS